MKRALKILLISVFILFIYISAYAAQAIQVDFLLAGYRHPTTDVVLSGGKVETYLAGTATLSSLWTDKEKIGTATNPIILDSTGKAEVFGDNIYDFKIYDSGDVLIETIPGVSYLPNTVEDGSITLSKLADGTPGNLISYDSGGSPSAVSTGTTGQILTSNGAGLAPSFQSTTSVRYGLVPSNDTDSDHDISISAGRVLDSDRLVSLYLSSEITKQIDAVFAEGDDAGGFYTNADPAADTFYYIYLIKKTSDSSIDVYIDVSDSAANIPSGYVEYRIVSKILTDNSSPPNIVNFSAHEISGSGIKYSWLAQIADLSNQQTTTSQTAELVTVSAPPGCIYHGWSRLVNELNRGLILTHSTGTDGSASGVVLPQWTATGIDHRYDKIDIIADSNSQIRMWNYNRPYVYLYAIGFTDPRVD